MQILKKCKFQKNDKIDKNEKLIKNDYHWKMIKLKKWILWAPPPDFVFAIKWKSAPMHGFDQPKKEELAKTLDQLFQIFKNDKKINRIKSLIRLPQADFTFFVKFCFKNHIKL